MLNVLRKKISDLSEQIDVTTVEIREKLEEMCLLDCLEPIITLREKLWRKETFLERESPELCGGWTRGRPYNVLSGLLLMTPTNLSSVSWLDLAESTFNCVEIFREYTSLNDLFIEHTLEDFHFERHLWRSGRNPNGTFMNLANKYFNHVYRCMQLENMFNTASTLRRKWDPERFQRYINSSGIVVVGDLEFHLKVFPRLLVEHCRDSELITNYFSLLCSTPYGVDAVIKHMSYNHLLFFLLHIVNRHSSHPHQAEFEAWIIRDLRLVERAVSMGQKGTLELLLGFGWPCECSLNSSDLYLTDLDWSRGAGDSRVLNLSGSSVFTTNFMFYLIDVALNSEETPHELITDCIRQLWRSIEAPYISLSDLEHFFYLVFSQEYPEGEVFQGYYEFISAILRVYPSECLLMYQPRSLLHLSRMKLRENLALPQNASRLPLPDVLKQYVGLRW